MAIYLGVIGLLVFIAGGLMYLAVRKRPVIYPETSEQTSRFGSVDKLYEDDIIAVRKMTPVIETKEENDCHQQAVTSDESVAKKALKPQMMVFHVMAKKNKNFLGYDLLQALLGQGFRFGDMNIFHRHQESQGQGPVMFSLASATEPGTFDILNMDKFSGSGLTLFMRLSGNNTIDNERLAMMIDTAKNLCNTLHGELLDHRRQPLSLAEAKEAISA